MFPWLSHHPPVSTYGVCLLVAFVAAWLWTRRRGRQAHVEPSRLDLLMPLLLAAGLVGAWLGGKLTDVLTGAPADSTVLLGGLLAGTAAGIAYALAIRLPLGILGDILAPPIALGVAIGRVGCVMAGCCYGRVCPDDLAFMSLRYPPGSFAALAQGRVAESLPVLPVPLFESVLCVLLAIALSRWRPRNDRGITGQRFLALALGYAGVRFALEFLRADNPPIGLLTFSQWTCLLIAALAIITWRTRLMHAERWHLQYPFRPPNTELSEAHDPQPITNS